MEQQGVAGIVAEFTHVVINVGVTKETRVSQTRAEVGGTPTFTAANRREDTHAKNGWTHLTKSA